MFLTAVLFGYGVYYSIKYFKYVRPQKKVENLIKNCDSIYLHFVYSKHPKFGTNEFKLPLVKNPENTGKLTKKFKIKKISYKFPDFAPLFTLILKKNNKEFCSLHFLDENKIILYKQINMPYSFVGEIKKDFYEALVEAGMVPIFSVDLEEYIRRYKDNFEASLKEGAKIPLEDHSKKEWVRGTRPVP